MLASQIQVLFTLAHQDFPLLVQWLNVRSLSDNAYFEHVEEFLLQEVTDTLVDVAGRKRVVRPLRHPTQRFELVARDDLQAWKPVEHPTRDQAQAVDSGVDVLAHPRS